jgi:predicted membrane chloride channel (bestrophin family)
LHYRNNILTSFFFLFLSLASSICSRYRVITLEDVLEELLQEEIYDENDQMEKEAEKIARWVGKKWKRLKRRREQVSIASVVVDAINASQESNSFNATNESTSLLQTNEGNQRNGSGLLGSIFQSLGINKDDSS